MEQLIVVYAKAVDDKELGVYLEDVFFGGIACCQDCANKIARECTNNVRGGTAIVRIMPASTPHSLVEVFKEARTRFDKLEREMVETEEILQANSNRSKRRRK